MKTPRPDTRTRPFLFWVALPPGVVDLGLFHDAGGLAEPFLDLRFAAAQRRSNLLEAALSADLGGLTLCFDSREDIAALLANRRLPPETRVVLSGPGDCEELAARAASLSSLGVAVGLEVSGREEARLAHDAGADFLVVSGNEAAGPVAAKTSLVLMQELADALGVPIVVRGGLGPRGAAAAFALGCAGTILDSQLVLLDEAGVDPKVRERLRRLSASDTRVVGDTVGRPFRLLPGSGAEGFQTLQRREREIFAAPGSISEKAREFEMMLRQVLQGGLADPMGPWPVGQGVAFAIEFSHRGWSLGQVLERYGDVLTESVARVKRAFPFLPGSALADLHGTRYPVVQGPMAVVTDSPQLAVEVARAGALPFVAAGGLDEDGVQKLLSGTRCALADSKFGLGLVRFVPTGAQDDPAAQVWSTRPDFVTLAGGDADQARAIEQAGVSVYTHAPTVAHVQQLLDGGSRGIILEGHEAGGHVGALGALVLWELAAEELLARTTEAVTGVRVLLAGGISGAWGSLAAAVIAAPLVDRGVAVGLQLGTAYLVTHEAVASGAVPESFRRALLEGSTTSLSGRTVNLPARWLDSPAVGKLVGLEQELVSQGAPLAERKRRVERASRACLRAALGREDGPEPAFMCGQGIAVWREPRSIAELHEDLTTGAARIAERCPLPQPHEAVPEDAIAIVGMGCIFPGASGVAEYWENILQGRDMVSEVPPDVWDPALFFNPDRSFHDGTYSKIGAFVRGFHKDPLKFRIPPMSEPSIDKVQFMVLEATHQALVDAGYLRESSKPTDTTLPRERTCVFVGHGSQTILSGELGIRAGWPRVANALRSTTQLDLLPEESRQRLLAETEELLKSRTPEFTEDVCAGAFSSLVAGRVANCFNLKGRAVVTDAACASALAAIDAGVEALRTRECDVALAGGADVRVDPTTYVFFCSLGALSNTGSFPFDERADGFVLGEGAGMLVLKRLDDALRDGNTVYTVIRGVGASSDGRVKGITAPDPEGQMRALGRAYEKLPFSPSTVSMIEAHATATPTGDSAEISSLNRFFGEHGAARKTIGLGSVKSMIGHLKAAAGVASVIKTAMALHTRLLPPTIHCERPREDVDWEATPFYLITETRMWEAGPHPRRAGVNAFGFGGINFHLVLEEPPTGPAGCAVATSAPGSETAAWPAEVFAVRGTTRSEVTERARELRAAAVTGGGSPLRELALGWSANGRGAGPCLALVARDREQLTAHIDTALQLLGDPSREEISAAQGIYYFERPLAEGEKVAFLFPGQGAQYPGMAAGLVQHFPFLEEIFSAVAMVARGYARSFTPDVLLAGADAGEQVLQGLAELLRRPDVNHPAMIALGSCILEVLSRAGVTPHMVAGHSVGEYAALLAAGVFDMESAIRVSTQRGCRITESCMDNGSMVGVYLPEEEIVPFLEETGGVVTIANRNCPSQTVISGPSAAVEEVVIRLEGDGARCVRLPVSSAFHSELLEPCVAPFRELLEAFPVNRPRIPVQSNLTGRAYEGDGDFAKRLRDTLVRHMVSPVQFVRNIESMYEDGARLFVEVGPGSTLCSFVDDTLADRPHWTVATNLPRRQPTLQLLHALAFCTAIGMPVDVSRIRPPRAARKPLRAASRRLAAASEDRPGHSQPASASPLAPILEQVFAGRDPAVVRDYLATRESFLRDFVQLDLEHFTGTATTAGERPAAARSAAPAVAADEALERRVIGLVAHKTGYPPELIGLDLDVEAELGLDSIKQVEIVSDLEKELGLVAGDDTRSRKYRIGTLRGLIERLRQLPSAPPAEPPVEAKGREEQDTTYGTDCRRWVCRPVSAPLPALPEPAALAGRRVLLLASRGGLAAALSTRLEAAGALVSHVPQQGVLEIPPSGMDVVIDLALSGDDAAPALEECAGWWERAALRAARVLEVAQGVKDRIQAMSTGNVLWVTVTSLGRELGAQATPPGGALAGIDLGIARCLAAESEGRVVTRVIDLDQEPSDEQVAEVVARELADDHGPAEVGYRDGGRFAIRWVAAEPDAGGALALGRDSVVLAIGGARGITAPTCRELARRSGARFVVVGQSPPPAETDQRPPDIVSVRDALLREAAEHHRVAPAEIERQAWSRVWAAERGHNLWRLRALASEVIYRQCDLLDSHAVTDLVSEVHERFGRIDLVIQGGGALVEKSIVDFTPEEVVAGMAPKALGTAHLLGALAGVDVGTFVNLSSISGRWGSPGQAPYSAGHEVAALLTTAMNERRSGRWINVYLGPWLSLGMTRRGPIMERLHRLGMNFITEEAGANVLADEVEAGSRESITFCGREVIDRTWWTAGPPIQKPPLLDHIEQPEANVAVGRRTVEPHSDRLVVGHSIQNEPLLPALVSLELIAQTASVLVDPTWLVTEVADATFPKTARFPRGEQREFITRARVTQTENDGVWLSGELFSTFLTPGEAAPEEVVHARCRIRFGHRPPPQEPSLVVACAGLGGAPVDATPLWGTFALGSRRGFFASVRSVLSVTRSGVVGELSGEAGSQIGTRPLLDNPFRLDAGPLLGVTSTILFRGCAAQFIAGIRSIRLFGHGEPSAPLLCRIAISHLGDGDEQCDSEAVDESGRVIERMSGIHKVRGGPLVPPERNRELAPEPIWDLFREHPTQREIRTLLGVDRSEVALANVSISLVAHALEESPDRIREFLSPRELADLDGLTNPKRRREWLAGRIAAKAAVISLRGRDAPLDPEVVIESAADGAPRVVLPRGTGTGRLPHVSITHSGDIAAAVAALQAGFGIDVESVGPSFEEVRDTFAGEEEIARMASATALEGAAVLACLWTTKEACHKASDPGRCAATEVVLEDVEVRGRYLLASLRHALIGRWRCVTFAESGYAYAVARFLEALPHAGGKGA